MKYSTRILVVSAISLTVIFEFGPDQKIQSGGTQNACAIGADSRFVVTVFQYQERLGIHVDLE